MRTKFLVELQEKNLQAFKDKHRSKAIELGVEAKLNECKSKTQVKRLLDFIDSKKHKIGTY